MKVFVIYDKQGKIRGTVASELDNFDIGSGTEMRIHKFEASELDRKDVPAYVRHLHTNFRVETANEPTLVPKES